MIHSARSWRHQVDFEVKMTAQEKHGKHDTKNNTKLFQLWISTQTYNKLNRYCSIYMYNIPSDYGKNTPNKTKQKQTTQIQTHKTK